MAIGILSGAGRASLCVVLALAALAPKISQAASTETVLTGAPNSSAAGQTVTFTATISAFIGAPTGTVTFNNGGTELGDVSVSSIGVDYSPIAAGDTHGCFLTGSGGVKCSGWTLQGRLGDGNTPDPAEAQPNPVDVSGLTTGAFAVATGAQHSCAVLNTGGVKCWGANFNGQLGDGTLTIRATPVEIGGLTNVRDVKAGSTYTCALTKTGGVKCWGDNSSGQLGDGTFSDSPTPVDVSGLTSGVTAISISPFGGHTCALTIAAGVKCWGQNGLGQIGDGTGNHRGAPVDVSSLTSGVSAIAVGVGHTCALTTVQTIKCWGSNLDGQFGDGTTTSSAIPVDASGLSGIKAITAGLYHTCALNGTGGAKCWGQNAGGQLGNGTLSGTAQTAPSDVSGLTSGASSISAGGYHTCALTTEGVAKCWGANHLGQLGSGGTMDSTVPGNVLLGTTVPVFGKALFSTASLAIGANSITATYNGDSNYDPSTSETLTQTVNQATSSTSLGSSDTTTTFGESVTFTATVTGSGATGTVTFKDGATTLGTGSLSSGTATFQTSALAVGAHTVTAAYGGDAAFSLSASSGFSQTVSKGGSATTLTVNPASSLPGQSVTLSAVVGIVAPAAGQRTGTVTFKDGAATLGSAAVSGNMATLSTSALAVGNHSLTAMYGGSANFASNTSAAKMLTVSPMVGGEFTVNASAGAAANAKQAPAIARLSDSSSVVLWESKNQDGSGIGVYGQRYGAAGAKSGSEFKANTATANDQKQPAVAGLTGGGFVAVWTSAGEDGSGLGIYGQRFSGAGAKLGAEFKVNTVATADQLQPAIAALSDGGFVTVWTSNAVTAFGFDIYAQRYNASGASVGAEFRVNTTTANEQSQPAVVGLASGFAVVWASKQVPAQGFDIYGQRYSSAAVKSGVEFRVNTTQASDQTQPSIAKLHDGSLVVSWTSNLQDTSGLGVYAQRYSAAGSKTGAEFRVNTTIASNQSQPSIAAFTDKGFAVVWTSQSQDGSGLGIYGQAYNAAGAKVNVEFKIASTTTGNQSQPRAAAFSAGAFTAVWASSAVTPQAIVGQRLKIGGI